MTQDTVPPADLTFGEAIGELERIVKALESGELELEESLERYERGVTLLRACQEKLSHAEQRVTMLIGQLESEGDHACATDAGEGSADE